MVDHGAPRLEVGQALARSRGVLDHEGLQLQGGVLRWWHLRGYLKLNLVLGERGMIVRYSHPW